LPLTYPPPDSRRHRRLLDSRVQADGELSDSDDEGEGGRRDYANHKDRGRESRSRSSETENGEMRRFGIGGGILGAGAASSTHGAGPSGHTTLISQTLKTPLAMDTDEPPSADNGVAAVGSGTSNGNGSLEITRDDMAVDENSTEDN
jgi:histone deacetylase 1/2